MKGIEAAFWVTLGKDPELKTSKTGTPYAGMNVVVVTGATDEGKDVSQWLRVTCFGDTAKAIASRAKKGDRVYVEGMFTMNQWNDVYGEIRHGLNVAAWKCERVASIGRNREKRRVEPEQRQSRHVESYGANPYKPRHHIGTAFKVKSVELEPSRRENPQVVGLNDDFRDELPF